MNILTIKDVQSMVSDVMANQTLDDLRDQWCKMLCSKGSVGFTDESFPSLGEEDKDHYFTINTHPLNVDSMTQKALVFLQPVEAKKKEVYSDLGQRICNLPGIDDDLKNVLLEMIEEEK